MNQKNKKIAVVCSGWHYPAQFYEAMSKQKMPEDWAMELYCASHRDPKFAIEEKKNDVFDENTIRGRLDKILYSSVIGLVDIVKHGWFYKEYQNTVGDWGNVNQWLEDHDYKQYDLFLFTHDDNLIIHDRVIADIVEDASFEEWDILTNSPGAPAGSIRGSFEFFKPKVLDLMGGKFDLSTISLTREGQTDNPKNLVDLFDWNNIVYPLNKLIQEHGLKTAMLSPSYRISAYVIEGERGYISKTHGENTKYEDAGLKYLQDNGIIK